MKKLIRQLACMRLPKFKTEEEETHFWNTHSPLDYPGEFMDVKEPFEFAPSLLKKAAAWANGKLI